MLKDQLQEVEKRIQAACDRAGRKREEVTLIAVSKTKPVETLQEAYDLGVRIFGEALMVHFCGVTLGCAWCAFLCNSTLMVL